MHQTFLWVDVRPAMLCLLVSGSLALTSRPAFAQQTATPSMSVCQARRTIVEDMQKVTSNPHAYHYLMSPPSGIAFNVGELEFQAEPGLYAMPNQYKKLFPRGIYRVEMKTLGEVSVGPERAWVIATQLRINGEDPLANKNLSNESNANIIGFLRWDTDTGHFDQNTAQRFAEALNNLRLYARNYDPSRGLPPVCFADKDEQDRIFVKFQQKAAAWRALPAKPPISDDVNKHWLLAEDELKEKHFDAALREYEAALEIEPLWPLGQFNAAMLSGELKNYDDAVWHMRCYLELTPNAPDAKDAHDQMLLWQARAEQQRNAK